MTSTSHFDQLVTKHNKVMVDVAWEVLRRSWSPNFVLRRMIWLREIGLKEVQTMEGRHKTCGPTYAKREGREVHPLVRVWRY